MKVKKVKKVAEREDTPKRFDYKSSNFSGAWHNDARYWCDEDSENVVPARLMSKLDINPTVRYCKSVWWFSVHASISNVSRGIYEVCLRMGSVRGNSLPGSTSVKICKSNEGKKEKLIGRSIERTTMNRILCTELVEVRLGRIALTRPSDVSLNMLNQGGHKSDVYFESFGLRRVGKSSIEVLTLYLCLNRLSNLRGDVTSACFASQKLYNGAPRAAMLIDAFTRAGYDPTEEIDVRVFK